MPVFDLFFMTNETFKITPTTALAGDCWLWSAEDKRWVDSSTLGNAALNAPDCFGFTHWRPKPTADEVIREAVSWVQNRLAVEGHPCPQNFITTSLWLEAIEAPRHAP